MPKTQPTHRTEQDSLGPVAVAHNCYWGAQTQRSLENFAFPAHTERMPHDIIHALAIQKHAAALANMALGVLDTKLGNAIIAEAKKIQKGMMDDQFPLVIWQTGSGTQSNMNINEVIANSANEQLGQPLGSKSPVHPNDHCNCSQSSNDTFPTAMHIAAVLLCHKTLLPAIERLNDDLAKKTRAFKDIIKVGRTHTQDATPISLGQVFSGYHAMTQASAQRIRHALQALYALAQGGSAVGTGLNTPKGFAAQFARHVADITGHPFTATDNTYAHMAAHDDLVSFSASLETLAVSLMKIVNDIRFLASGPRSGLGELILPANEPGSSIMPGKVNPTQCESLSQICVQVMGNHSAVTIAGSQGHFELNVYKPVIIHNVLRSLSLLAHGITNFHRHCLTGVRPHKQRIQDLMEQSLMLVTALNPHIGYENAAKIAQKAHQDNSTLKQAAIALGLVNEQQFDAWVRPQDMIRPYEPS
ncbi:MAG: class II fumarate hydratase [Alphaproteobacteria bacterium GM7ARS4]|nr:class II fumarate hydratase [Alphaproteobacteria bacterium GM7ARS4]